MVRPSIAIPVLLGLLASGNVARADPRTDKAREHYLQADAYYKVDKYREALAEYEQAYIAKPDPSFLYNIGQCHRLMGNKGDAVRFYRRYLKDAPSAPNRALTEKQIRDLETALANEVPLVNEPMRLPRPSGTGPTPMTSAVGSTGPPSPAPPTAAVPVTSVLLAPTPPALDEASPGTTIPDVSAPPSRDPDSRPPVYTRWWFWTAVGVAVVGGVAIAVASRDPSCLAGRTCQ